MGMNALDATIHEHAPNTSLTTPRGQSRHSTRPLLMNVMA